MKRLFFTLYLLLMPVFSGLWAHPGSGLFPECSALHNLTSMQHYLPYVFVLILIVAVLAGIRRLPNNHMR